MSYLSNKLIYGLYKYGPLAMSSMFLYFIFRMLWENNINDNVIGSCSVFLLLSLLFTLVFLLSKNHITQVELSLEKVLILTFSREISWDEVASVDFKWFGLYQLKLKSNETYYFPPFEFSINFFGYRLFPDDFDRLIERKKNELGI